jgi:murein DD-endopeptidase MepM/ murein hydrolase activator NlpD
VAPKTPGGDRPLSIYSRIVLGTAVALVCVGAAGASAQTTTTTTTSTTTAPATGTGTDSETEAAQSGETTEKADATKLKLENVSPGRIFYAGTRKAVFKYEIGGRQPRNLKIQAVRRGHGVVRDWTKKDVEPKTKHKLRWGGTLAHGKEAPKGKYFFRVKDGNGQLDRSNADGDRQFGVYPDIFPVRGRHGYGDGWGAGRHHTGQDVFANCGTKIAAARAGKVAFVGSDAGGYGHYLVINTKGERRAHLYAHLKRKPAVHRDERVRTGEKVGVVGQSGNAQGCHLHFEYWKGNFGNGRAQPSVTKHLKRWDKWS